MGRQRVKQSKCGNERSWKKKNNTKIYLEDLQAVIDRDKKRLPLELQLAQVGEKLQRL